MAEYQLDYNIPRWILSMREQTTGSHSQRQTGRLLPKEWPIASPRSTRHILLDLSSIHISGDCHRLRPSSLSRSVTITLHDNSFSGICPFFAKHQFFLLLAIYHFEIETEHKKNCCLYVHYF